MTMFTEIVDAPLDPVALDTLARTIWGEARGEGALGMQAVAAVVMNRVRSGRFGPDATIVCRARRQFSCWNDGDPNREKLLSAGDTDPRFRAALRIARRALAGLGDDPTQGSTHYDARYVNPRRARGRAPAAEIGRHVFYNDVE